MKSHYVYLSLSSSLSFPMKQGQNGKRRTSVSALTDEAGLTVEAALVVPLWMAAIVALLFLMIAMHTQVKLQRALYHQALNMSGYAYYVNKTDIPEEAQVFLEAECVKMAVIQEVGAGFWRHSFIENGPNGIFLNFLSEKESDILDIALEYRMRPPYDLLGVGSLTLVSRVKCHSWIGLESSTELKEVTTVYVTAEGEVYHSKRDCTYIKVTFDSCKYSAIDRLRNPEGSKYYPCVYCTKGNAPETVFYMKYGTRYHYSLDCPNFHRNVYSVELESAKEKYRPCSKCGEP